MKYYILTNSTGEDVGNVEGIQLKSRSDNYHYNAPNSLQYLPNLSRAHETPNLNFLIVEPKANMTDFISCKGIINATGYLISQSAKSCLENLTLPPCQFYPAKLLHKSTVYEYYWLHFEKDFSDKISFSSSLFVLKSYLQTSKQKSSKDYTDIDIVSMESLIKTKREYAGMRQIAPKSLVLKMESLSIPDILTFSSFGDESVIISEKLKTAIFHNKLTGCEIRETPYSLTITE